MDCQSMAFVPWTQLFGGKLSPVVRELGRSLYLNMAGAASEFGVAQRFQRCDQHAALRAVLAAEVL
jgi:hypothetical protein